MFKFVLYGNMIFDTLEHSSFQKYATYWVFLALCHMLYFCICIFVFVRWAHENIIFDILEQSSFQKYTTYWVVMVIHNMLYLCICTFDKWEYHFWYPWTILFSKIYHMLGLSGTLPYAVFVYLCICVFVYLYFCICAFDTCEYHFWYLWTILFSKIYHMLGLSGTS